MTLYPESSWPAFLVLEFGIRQELAYLDRCPCFVDVELSARVGKSVRGKGDNESRSSLVMLILLFLLPEQKTDRRFTARPRDFPLRSKKRIDVVSQIRRPAAELPAARGFIAIDAVMVASWVTSASDGSYNMTKAQNKGNHIRIRIEPECLDSVGALFFFPYCS